MIKFKFTSKEKQPLLKLKDLVPNYLSPLTFNHNGDIKKKNGIYTLKAVYTNNEKLILRPHTICYYNEELGKKLYPDLNMSRADYLMSPESDIIDILQNISAFNKLVKIKATIIGENEFDLKLKVKLLDGEILKVKIKEYDADSDMNKKIKKLDKEIIKTFPFMQKSYVSNLIKTSKNVKETIKGVNEFINDFKSKMKSK